jgi:hypothetical protein
VQNGEEPCPEIGAFAPQMQLGEAAYQAVLDKIVRRDDITRERASVPTQAGDFRFYSVSEVEVGHPDSPVFLLTGRWPIGTGVM